MKNNFRKTRHSRLLGLALAAVLVGVPGAAGAAPVDAHVNNAAEMGSAVDSGNNSANAVDALTIDILNDITIDRKSGNEMTPNFWIYGNTAPSTGSLGAVRTANVLISGGSSQKLIQFTSDTSANSGRSAILGIINVTGNVGLERLHVKGGLIKNDATANSLYYSGAGIYIGAVNTTIGVQPNGGTDNGQNGHWSSAGPSFDTATLTNVTVSENVIDLTTIGADVAAAGAGLFIDGSTYASSPVANGIVELTNVDAFDNRVTINGLAGTTGSTAQGGGISIKNLADLQYTGGLVSGNIAQTINGANAHGGGMSFDDNSHSGTLTNVTFMNNQALVSGTVINDGTAAMAARGGGLFVINEMSDGRSADATVINLKNSLFEGNLAGSSGNNFAQGGAFAMMGEGEAIFDGVTFKNNIAEATGSGTYAQALGGAIFAGHYNDVPEVTVANSNLTGNQAKSASGGQALGGAIFMDTAGVPTNSGPVTLNLSADAGRETVISGNSADGQADGIVFASNNGTSKSEGVLNINGPGTVKLLDPLKVLMDAHDFTMTKEAAATFHWDGRNILDAGNDTAKIDFSAWASSAG